MLSLGRQKKKDKYKQMKNEPHKKTGKVSPYPGGKFVLEFVIGLVLMNSRGKS